MMPDLLHPSKSSAAKRRACIVGLGGDCGDDRAGWQVIWRLKELVGNQNVAGMHLLAARTPAELLDIADSASRLVVIDACQGLASPGDFVRLRWPNLPLVPSRHGCGHNVSLVQALEIAQCLGQLPEHCELWCIEGRQFDFAIPPSAEVSHAAERVALEILQDLESA